MLAVPAGAQTVSTSDIQRLQDDVYQASSDISRLRSTDASTASRLQDELDDLRDEVTYLKVKLRKEGTISRSDYTDVRERLQTLRSRAHGDSSQRSARFISSVFVFVEFVQFAQRRCLLTIDRERPARDQRTIPDGQEIDVRLERELSSATAQVEDRFEATTVVDLYDGQPRRSFQPVPSCAASSARLTRRRAPIGRAA